MHSRKMYKHQNKKFLATAGSMNNVNISYNIDATCVYFYQTVAFFYLKTTNSVQIVFTKPCTKTVPYWPTFKTTIGQPSEFR